MLRHVTLGIKIVVNNFPNRKRYTYGSFILMKTLLIPKLIKIEIAPIKSNRDRLSFGMLAAFDLSKIINPIPPSEKRKDAAKPSMMYWPLTLKNSFIINNLPNTVSKKVIPQNRLLFCPNDATNKVPANEENVSLGKQNSKSK